MFQEGFSARRPHAGDRIQRGGHALLRAPRPMGGDAKAVRLVADSLHEIQRLRVTRQLERLGLVREENLLLLLGEADHRDFVRQPGIFQDFDDAAQLSLSTVNNDQIRQDGERRVRPGPWAGRRFPGRLPPSESPRQHFLHGGEVIGRADGSAVREAPLWGNIELAIQPLGRHTLLEDHHRADGGDSLRVRHIVALDTVRRRGQSQCGLQLGQRLLLLVRVRLPLGAQSRQCFRRVLRRHLDKFLRLALTRDADFHFPAAAPRTHPLADDLGFLDLLR